MNTAIPERIDEQGKRYTVRKFRSLKCRPKADVPTGLAPSLLPTQIASANIAELVTGKRDMAEGLLGGVLGDEDEKPDVEAPDALAGAEAFAAAVAARFSASDPEVARDTSAFLKEQTDLLRVQK